MRYTLFSIDDEASPALRQSFETMFKEDRRTVGSCIPLTGMYKGKREYSYICLSDDFNIFVLPMGFVANQESILRISECNKKYTTLVILSGGSEKHLGCMKSVTEEQAMKSDAWSYRPDLDQYFIAVKGNNDHYSAIVSGVDPEETARFHAERCQARSEANGG